jgi:phosphoglycerate dehydrogenase-like enzyme
MEKCKSAIFCNLTDRLDRVYTARHRQKIEELTDCYPAIITNENFAEHAPYLKEIEVIFTTWGMPVLSPEEVECLSSLKAIFYAAGSVQSFARLYLEKGVLVFSAWVANAVPVAEFTLAQILLSNKGYFRNSRESRNRSDADRAFLGQGNYGESVALLGAGQVGQRVIKLLKPFNLKILVFDPFLPDDSVEFLGVTRVSLEEAFQEGYVISNHLANLPPTMKMLRGVHFDSMRKGATFINTGRAQTVHQVEMVEILEKRPDLTALLDVYHYPEEAGERLHQLSNVHFSTHIAGSIADEQQRMGDWMLDEYINWSKRNSSRFQVNLEMLTTMA